MPETINSGRGCQLVYDGDALAKRVIVFGGDHPLPRGRQINRSVEFQNRAVREGLRKILPIERLERDSDTLDFFYTVSGFSTDLYQLAREKRLRGSMLADILLQTIQALLAVQTKFHRTHGDLGLESILIRSTLDGKAEITLTDFLPDPAAGTAPDTYEKEDLRGLGGIIAAAALIKPDEDTLDSRRLRLDQLPQPDDRQACERLGRDLWPKLRTIAEDLLQPRDQLIIQTLAQLQALLQGGGGTPQTISFSQLPDRTFGDPAFQLNATATSHLKVDFSVTPTALASLRGNTISLLGAGRVTVKASQGGNEGFLPAPDVERSFGVAKAPQTIRFGPPNKRTVDDPPFDIAATATSRLAVRCIVASGPAAIENNKVTVRGRGRVDIKGFQEGNENYLPTEAMHSFEVAGHPQTIRFERPPDGTLGSPFALMASASSGLPVGFAVVSGPAEFERNLLRLTGKGTVVIRAFQLGNEIYEPAPEVRQSFVVTGPTRERKPQTITFTPVGNRIFGQPPFRLVARAIPSGLPVNFSVESGPATVSNDELTLIGAGSVTVKAQHPGNDEYLPAEAAQVFQALKARQTTSFAALRRDLSVGDSITLQATASSTLEVTFIVVAGKAELSGNQLRLTTAGSLSIKATQPGNENYEPAEAVQTVQVAKGKQTITLELPVELVFGQTATVQARTSSGLPIKLEVLSGPAGLSGNQLTLHGTGELKLRATQPGDENYFPAPEVIETRPIGKAPQELRFDPPLPLEIRAEDSLTVSGLSNSALPVAFNLLSGQGTLTGNRITANAAGVLQIEARQEGNDKYQPASIVQSVKVVKRKQEIEFKEIADCDIRQSPIVLEATATSGLPVTFSVVSGQATISGKELTLRGRGMVEIVATQDGNRVYAEAEPVPQSFKVGDRRLPVLYGAIFALLCIGGLAGWLLYNNGKEARAMADFRAYIRANQLAEAMGVLESGRLRATVATPLKEALRSAPILTTTPEVIYQGQTKNFTIGLAWLLEGRDLSERDFLETNVQWSATLTSASSDLTPGLLTPQISIREGVKLEIKAGDSAATGKCELTLVLSNQLASIRTNLHVLVKPPAPVVEVSGSAKTCSGDPAEITATITGGKPPWTIVWSDGETQRVATARTITRSVQPGNDSVFAVTNLLDESGEPAPPTNLRGQAKITVKQPPRVSVQTQGTDSIYAGEVAQVEAKLLNGTPPWTVIWSTNGVRLSLKNVEGPSDVLQVTVPTLAGSSLNVTCRVETLSSGGCQAKSTDLGGSIVVVINPRPTASVTGTKSICAGDPAEVQATLGGVGPWTVTWSSNGVNLLPLRVSSSVHKLAVSPSADTEYRISALSDSKFPAPTTNLTGVATISVKPLPTATVFGGGRIQAGESSVIRANLNGKAPLTVTWSDQVTQIYNSTSAVYKVKPLQRTVYSIGQLTDANGCAARDLGSSAVVEVEPSYKAPEIKQLGTVTVEVGKTRYELLTVNLDDRLANGLDEVRIECTSSKPEVVVVNTNFAGKQWQLCLTGMSEGTADITLSATDAKKKGVGTTVHVQVKADPKHQENLSRIEVLAVQFSSIRPADAKTLEGKTSKPRGSRLQRKEEQDLINEVNILKAYFQRLKGGCPNPKINFEDIKTKLQNFGDK
jgi:hypothetical protein